MRVRATLPCTQVPAGTTTATHLVLSLHGESATTRPPVAVLPVVDRSGSMAAGGKLTTVTAALAHLSSLLAPTDRLALVSFDTTVRTDVPTRAADAAGVRALTDALARLAPGATTNLHDALTAAVVAANRTSAETLTRVVVLTDGRANVGPVDTATLAAVLAERAPHVSVSFLGVGTDCDHAQLGALAEAGGGSYGFIESAADAPDVLGAEVGGLLDAEATHVTATISPRTKHARLTGDGPLGRPGTVSADPDTGTLTITVPTVLSGVTRDVVLPVELFAPKRPHARPVTFAEVTVTATIAGEQVTHTLRPKVHFAATAGDPDPTIVEVVELAQVAHALRTANRHADTGDFAGARSVLDALAVSSGKAETLLTSSAGVYASATTYNAGTSQVSSTIAAVTGTLSGSSRSFDALAARTLGGYRSAGQTRTAATATAAVTSPKATSPAAAPNPAPAPFALTAPPAAAHDNDDVDAGQEEQQ